MRVPIHSFKQIEKLCTGYTPKEHQIAFSDAIDSEHWMFRTGLSILTATYKAFLYGKRTLDLYIDVEMGRINTVILETKNGINTSPKIT